MIQRELSQLLRDMASKMPIISITGPRQSGKTTLARLTFPDYEYVNLENPDTLEAAVSDPRLFLSQFQSGVIIDEAQRYPDLFSYIQTASDEANRPGKYILTGSLNFLLLEKISQSLAGRVFITHLLPLSIAELRESGQAVDNFEKSIFQGFYPRLHDADIHPTLFYPSYIQTYVERDVRQIVNVGNLHQFQRFMRLAAGRIGQLLNYSHIANELGVDLKTVKSWFSILETSFITFVLRPHFQNFSKRILKTPKLYFYDTGLACSLLGIRDERELATHWARGPLFENMVVSDLMKYHYNRAIVPPLYYWRDSTGNEVDCLIDSGLQVKSIEIKSSSTISSDFFKGLNYYGKLNAQAVPYLIYGGLTPQVRREGKVIAWNSIVDLF
ncbi:MAG: ATP-binding protein [Fermentimonas sp.]|jgi:predicted AAA+ superfamily ATPase